MGQRIPEKEIANFQFVELNTAPIAAEVSKEIWRLFLAKYIDNHLCICYTIRIDDYQCEVFL